MDLHALLIEDDPVAGEFMKGLLAQRKDVHVVGWAQSAPEAIELIGANEPDFLILDVELARDNGLDVLAQLVAPPPAIITTAFSEYAVQAFQLDAVDFIVKPVSEARFAQALNRVRDRVGLLNKRVRLEPCIFVRLDRRYQRVALEAIQWVEAFGDYTKLHTRQKTYTVHVRLHQLATHFHGSSIHRIHRSYAVNLNALDAIGHRSVWIDEREIPVSRAAMTRLRRLLPVFQ